MPGGDVKSKLAGSELKQKRIVDIEAYINDTKNNTNKIYKPGIIFFTFSIVLILALYYCGMGSWIVLPGAAGTASAGIGILVILYILAQLVERFVEPISNNDLFGGYDKEDLTPEELPRDPNKAHEYKTILSNFNNARAISLMLLASGLGIIICYLTTGILQVIGITFSSVTFSPLGLHYVLSASQGHVVDALISGVIVGGGTKPLHDLINIIDTKGNCSDKK